MKVIIAGGGIGGLTTALVLQNRGIDCVLFEQSREIRELGVGITVLPHAVRQLASLDLLAALDAIAIRSEHLFFMTRRGQAVWDEPRGLLAGHDVPQFFIHRGMLHALLFEAARRRLPAGSIQLGRRLEGFRQTGQRVEADFSDREGGAVLTAAGDVLVGADGIHSVLRRQLEPAEGPPLWSGVMLWRGATEWPRFLGGATQLICGGVDAKFVCYPIGPGRTDATRLTNWAVNARIAPNGSIPPRREDWSRPGRIEELAPLLKQFTMTAIDPEALVRATPVFFEYPMCDRDPIARWSHGRVTLLGDAAHPMYPMGANGASQAILDARCLVDALTSHADPATALQAYERDRLPGTAEIVRLNRVGGPEAVIDAIETRAPNGFADIDTVLSHAEREKIVRGYASKASAMTQR